MDRTCRALMKLLLLSMEASSMVVGPALTTPLQHTVGSWHSGCIKGSFGLKEFWRKNRRFHSYSKLHFSSLWNGGLEQRKSGGKFPMVAIS
jgi:hypothetical protein